MKADTHTLQKITKDFLISIFLFALPVLLMLLSFKLTGKQPWKEKTKPAIQQSK